MIQQKFIKKKVGDCFVCFARRLKRNKYLEILSENRKNKPSIFGDKNSKNFIDIIPTKKDKNSSSDNSKLVSSSIVPQNMSNTNDDVLIDGCIDSSSFIDFTDDQRLANEDYSTNPSAVVDKASDIVFDETLIFRSVPDIQPALKRSILSKKLRSTVPQSNTLNFSSIKNITVEHIKKFAPLSLKSATFVYDKNNIILGTQRKRDDLVNPVKLQFIKHFDQARPPIYQKRGLMERAVFSYRKLSEVLSYDYDSSDDWEIFEESTETLDEYSEDTSIDSDVKTEEGWIEKDSEDAETTRYSKKPSLVFECDVCIETFFEERKFLHANLILSENFSKELQDELEKYKIEFQGGFEELVSSFSALYNVCQGTVQEKLIKMVYQEKNS
ncbi:uncharacterized protein VICG_01103 [Vittaforma corneae ATCC 50505]|uniref:Uncharacterized protein n=1 Tax=Vittaforma corneae (strain ATCC 50505) TaxID=993615 RepID=L2GMQ3_VITCO|nr:uncharacterized protein VICG_01103 [Vittaforma corneae ATCC 50505]ELA41919.1 hypothetical protein VICG_01103 [Vittaforma corneae ATCC 50505]